MGKVLTLTDYKPHVVVESEKRIYVIPVQHLEDLSTGKLKVNNLEYAEDIISTIVKEWLLLKGFKNKG